MYKRRWFLALETAVLCTALLLVVNLMPSSGSIIDDGDVPLASQASDMGHASSPPSNSRIVVRMSSSYLKNFNMTLETWTDVIGEQAYESSDGSVTVLLSQPSRDLLVDWYGQAVDERIDAVMTQPETGGLFAEITSSDDRTELSFVLSGDTYDQSHYLVIWRLQKLCYRYVLFSGDQSPVIHTTVRFQDGRQLEAEDFPADPDELSPEPGGAPLLDAATGKPSGISFHRPFEFDGLEITFQDHLVWDVVDSPSSPLDGADVVKIPVSVTNLSDRPHGLNPLAYSIIGPGGPLEDVNVFFGHDIDRAEQTQPGDTVVAYMCILYDGDGEYSLAFDNRKERATVVLTIEKDM